MNGKSMERAILENIGAGGVPTEEPPEPAVDKVVADTGEGYAPDANMTIKDDEAGTYSLEQFHNEGKAVENGTSPEDVDQEQLARGVEMEGEHTSDPGVARSIAMDHLSEIPDYYTRLGAMEKQARAEGGMEPERETPEPDAGPTGDNLPGQDDLEDL